MKILVKCKVNYDGKLVSHQRRFTAWISQHRWALEKQSQILGSTIDCNFLPGYFPIFSFVFLAPFFFF